MTGVGGEAEGKDDREGLGIIRVVVDGGGAGVHGVPGAGGGDFPHVAHVRHEAYGCGIRERDRFQLRSAGVAYVQDVGDIGVVIDSAVRAGGFRDGECGRGGRGDRVVESEALLEIFPIAIGIVGVSAAVVGTGRDECAGLGVQNLFSPEGSGYVGSHAPAGGHKGAGVPVASGARWGSDGATGGCELVPNRDRTVGVGLVNVLAARAGDIQRPSSPHLGGIDVGVQN